MNETERDRQLDAAWSAASREEPPAPLDAAIRDAARAVDAAPRPRRDKHWWYPLAAAATVAVLAVAIIQLAPPQQVAPTIVADVKPEMRISCDELFGPAVAVAPFDDIDQAIALANDSQYGLAAGIFTENLEWAWKFAREVQSGNLHVNWGPQWRADLMPYGGLKESGFGKEGPAYAIEEMTELKMVVFHLAA